MNLEYAALASILSGGWNFGGYELSADDFVDRRCRDIFVAIKRVVDSGAEPDIFTVAAQLPFEIDDLLQITVSAKSIGSYAKQLKDETLKRSVHRVCSTVLAGSGAGREQLLKAQSLLASLEPQLSGGGALLGDYVDSWWQEVGKRAEGGDWLHTGFPDVDRRLGGLRGGDLIIIGGRPAMGKTALALNIATNCKKRVAFFSLEMQADGLLDRLAASLAKVPLGTIRSGKMTDDEWHRLSAASGKIKSLPITLDEQAGLSIEEIHSRARSIKSKSGLDLVVVDYLQLITTDKGMSQYEKVTHISQWCKRMAKDLDVPVIMLAQLSRKSEERGDKRPIMSDLRDSGSIEQDADVIALVHREEVYSDRLEGYAEVIFRKVRQGCTGSDWFLFDGATQTFKQTDEPAHSVKVMPKPIYGMGS